MGFSDKLTMAFLEEDNTQRAFFRLRPLLNDAGPCSQEEMAVLPDEGFVRIVPDKNELSNFKDRMRKLGRLCIIDLTPFPPEANKIRTNKNYAPDKGEKNQYILYSDVIRALPDSLVYEVAEANTEDDFEEIAASLATPLGYIHLGDQWFGPMGKGHAPSRSSEVPSRERMHRIAMPDGKQHTFFWPESLKAADTAPQPIEDAGDPPPFASAVPEYVPLSELESAAKPAVSQVADHPVLTREANLSGTPLYTSAPARPRLSRPHNPLHEVVDAQWRAAKYEAPSAQLQQGASLRHVENPLEQFRHTAERAWAIPEAQQQLLDTMLSLPGMQQRLEKMLHSGEPDSLLVASMRRQLQELEAERLTLLVQLGKAKENKAAFREEMLLAAQQEHTARLKQLKDEITACQKTQESLSTQLRELMDQRSALQAVCDDLARGDLPIRLQAFAKGLHLTAGTLPLPRRLSPTIGTKVPPDRLISSLRDAFAKKWGSLKPDDAVHFLVLFALCQRIQVVHPSLAEALRFTHLCTEAIGLKSAFTVQTQADQNIIIHESGCTMSPVCVATPYLQQDEQSDVLKSLLLSNNSSTYIDHVSYALAPWPMIFLPETAADFQPAAPLGNGELPPPVSMESLKEFTLSGTAQSQEISRWLVELKEIMSTSGQPLPMAVSQLLSAYISVAGTWMQGGIAAAADYAFQAWIIPHALQKDGLRKAIKPMLPSLPRSGELLKRYGV